MTYRHEGFPARKCDVNPVRKNAKSVWTLAIASLFALTLSGCGDWRDPSVPTAGETVAKDLDTAPSSTPTTIDVDTVASTPPSSTAGSPTPVTGQDNTAGSGEVPPPAAPEVTQGTAINSVDVMIDDMRLMNDVALKNVNPVYGWAHGPGYVLMGNDPRGINTPSWWQSANPSLVNGNYLTHLLPWAVMFEGVGNSASNTRVQIRNLRAFVLSKSSGQWRQSHSADRLDGHYCPQDGNYYGCSQGMDERSEPSGGASIKPQPGMNVHGWFGGRAAIDGPDVGAVVVTFESRLVLDNPQGTDDRAGAKYLFHVGADYYPGNVETVLMPAVGISRSKLVSSDWKAFNMTTFSDIGSQEPGGGISQAQLRANPPPIN